MSELIAEEKMIEEPTVFKITIKRKEGGKDIIETRDVHVDTTSIHPGTAKELSEGELDVRRLLGLPLTKDLVYYPDPRDNRNVPVTDYRIAEMYDISDPWFTITFSTGSRQVCIHSMFFAEMQKPSFVTDMKKAAEAAQ